MPFNSDVVPVIATEINSLEHARTGRRCLRKLFSVALFHRSDVCKISGRQCVNNPDTFCYICGIYVISTRCRQISEFVLKAYFAYFGMKLGDQDKSFAPHIVCHTCVVQLRKWSEGKMKCLNFAIPMVWHEQKNHVDDCYFCMDPPILYHDIGECISGHFFL